MISRYAADKLLIALLIVVFAGAGWFVWKSITAPRWEPAFDALDSVSDPRQRNMRDSLLVSKEKRGKQLTIMARAEYSVSGILVGKKRYRFSMINELVPWDYAIAWGRVPQMFPHLRFSQSGRFARYRYKDPSLIDLPHLQSHMSNNHLIPANANVRKALALGRKGQPVRIEGWLADIRLTSKGRLRSLWQTSLKREDIGMGACEIIYVRRVRLGDRLYQ